jgi:cytochrome P450
MIRGMATAAPAPLADLVAAAPSDIPAGPPLPMPVQTVLWMLFPIPFGRWCHRRYGDAFTLRLPFNGRIVQLADPEAIRAVFTARPNAARAGEANTVLEPIVGSHSVLLLDGAEHMRQRKLMLPAFHGDRMRRYIPLVEAAVRREMEAWPTGKPFSLRPSMQSLTLEVILSAVFGADEGEERDHLRSVLLALLDLPRNPLGLLPWFRRDTPRSSWGRFLRRREAVDAAVLGLIAARRAEAEGAGAPHRDDILSLLLVARDDQGEPMSDTELRDELMTLLLAGHETTATGLAWFFELAARRPGVVARLRHDLAAGSGAYLDACIKETLRLRPVVPVVARRLHAPLELPDRTLPAGIAVAPNIVLTHHNPRIWPEPDEFRPERFIGARTDLAAWLPFGGGVRRCLGASFATLEMRVVIPAVLGRFDLAPATKRPETALRRAVTLVPQHGARVIVTPAG